MLTKSPTYTYYPPVPGKPAVPAEPASPERKVCGSQMSGSSAGGVSCRTVRIYIYSGSSIPPGSGGSMNIGASPGGTSWVDTVVCYAPSGVASPAPVSCRTIPAREAQPAQPEVPPVPARVDVTPSSGWNAGANSVKELDGDVVLRFKQPRAVGVVLGLTTTPESVPAPERVSHGWYFYQTSNGAPRCRVYEAGRVLLDEQIHDPAAEYRVERVSGTVSYWVDDEQMLVSTVASVGPIHAATSLFTTGDEVPTALVQAPA